MKKALLSIIAFVLITTVFAGCSSFTSSTEDDTLTIVWYPNESGEELKGAREEIEKVIAEKTGKKIEHKLTTDYVIAIEAIATGNADLAFLGAQGYIEAHKKNDKVLPLVVSSGTSGTLEDAVYYSWLNVKKGNEDKYKSGDKFSIDNIVDKRFSFVSNSSTSGFKVPSAGIVGYFSKKDQWKDLTQEDLIEGGKFFDEVLFGGSHQGSAVNLLTGKADVAAFCDVCVGNYVEHESGTPNRPGAIYKVKNDAAEPFNTLPGEEFVLISVTPVLNAPFVVNTETVSVETVNALVEVMTSDEVANNPNIFVPKESEFTGLWSKKADERFVKVTDDWFNPIRELSN